LQRHTAFPASLQKVSVEAPEVYSHILELRWRFLVLADEETVGEAAGMAVDII
jgi:hypothetical protein